MTGTNPNPVSVAITMHDAERLRRLAASARTNEGRMALNLLSAMLGHTDNVGGFTSFASPMASNKTEEGRAKNRRVQLVEQ